MNEGKVSLRNDWIILWLALVDLVGSYAREIDGNLLLLD